MGMSNSYQLFCFMFAVIKVLFLTSAIYQFATCKYECPPSSVTTFLVFATFLLTLFPTLMIIGILKKHLQLVRIYKVYSLVEKSLIIFFMIVSSFFMVELVQLYTRKHYMDETAQVSVLLFHAVNGCLILLTALYMIFRNWMMNGTVESIKQDIALKRGETFVLTYHDGYSVA
ncbi:hypothetical protein quinque_011326 [Culex quinquefasciatus]|uniref:(northern house mosquito) hypothetical protein n=1 Tax=Culex pipiens TaxID=7175 RepID=A0A8D8F2E1_CULPI